MNKPICCICGKECENEWGNNPYPVNNTENARCCDTCNDLYVIPARIANLMAMKYSPVKKEMDYDETHIQEVQ